MAGLIGHNGVFAGFADGCVIAGRLSPDGEMEDLLVKGSSGAPVAALALTPEGWLFAGEDTGRVLWVPLGGDEA